MLFWKSEYWTELLLSFLHSEENCWVHCKRLSNNFVVKHIYPKNSLFPVCKTGPSSPLVLNLHTFPSLFPFFLGSMRHALLWDSLLKSSKVVGCKLVLAGDVATSEQVHLASGERPYRCVHLRVCVCLCACVCMWTCVLCVYVCYVCMCACVLWCTLVLVWACLLFTCSCVYISE